VNQLSVSNANTPATYRQVAELHQSCINQGFLSTLGIGFLTLLYESIDADKRSVLIVATSDGVVTGFVSGGLGMRGIYLQLLRRWIRLVPALFPVFLNPSALRRILEIILMNSEQPRQSRDSRAELLSIAVRPSSRGSGIAQELYYRLQRHFANEGEAAFYIVVGNKLTFAHRFYLNMGAKAVASVCVHREEESTLFRQDLSR
jgi:ribosomal protein S18 acetylase RimI-like enzyme